MKKTKLTRSLLAACSIVALSAVMYGCTSDGSKNDLIATQEALDQERADHAATQADLDTANGEVTRLTGELDTANGDVTRLMGELDTANGEVTRIQGLLDTASGDVTRLMGELDTANGEVTRLTGELGTATGDVTRLEADLATAETDRDHYKAIVDKSTGEGVAQDDKDEAMRIAEAIDPDSTRPDADGDLGTDDVPFDFDHTDGGKFVENPASPTDMNDDFAMSADMPASISGWAGSMHTRETDEDVMTTMDMNESVMDTVVVYTDQADPTDQAYDEYFSQAAAQGRDGVESATELGVLSLSTDQTGNHERFSTAFGITAAHQEVPITHDDPDTTDVETESEFMGMFYGVAGTFTCTGTCTVESDDMRNLSMLNGTWTFTPTVAEDGDLGDIMVAGVVPDPDYLTMGYWLRTDFSGEDGAMKHQVLAYAEGNRDYGSVAAVEGKAKYVGPATGLYMRKVLDSSGTVTPVESGQFTADASLTAYFGQVPVSDDDPTGTIAPNLLDSISGSVSGFEDSDGNMIDAAWTVELMKGAIDMGAGTFMGATTGMGEYEGTFHGAAGDDATAAPVSASGTFDGHFSNGHVYGAFGADKE